MFDYDDFVKRYLLSDKKLKKMLGEGSQNVEARTMHRDLEIEIALLDTYLD